MMSVPHLPLPQVSIVIPAYRSALLQACLDSLAHLDDDGVSFDVYVILNDATPEVVDIARANQSATVHIVDLPMNLGTGGAYNLAFAASDAPYLVCLQDDSVVEPGFLRNLLRRIESADDIGAAGALVTDLEGQVWDAGWVIWCNGITSPVWADGSRDPKEFTSPRAVAQHGTMGTMIRREAWESIGGFDDAFYPLMYADVDASVSLRRRGWRIVVEPQARASQAVNTSTTSEFRTFLLDRNRALLLEKHGKWLTHAPTHSHDPTDIRREVERIAATPRNPKPEPPSEAELTLLRSRLVRSPEQFLRRERDLLTAYASWLEVQNAEFASNIDVLRAEVERMTRRATAAETSAVIALQVRDDALRERDTTHRELESIALSKTWRCASVVRSAARRVRARLARRT